MGNGPRVWRGDYIGVVQILDMQKLLLAVVLSMAVRLSGADLQWVLEQSKLSYHVSHPLHQTDGVSKQARGKGSCHAGQCDFLIAAEVKILRFGR